MLHPQTVRDLTDLAGRARRQEVEISVFVDNRAGEGDAPVIAHMVAEHLLRRMKS
ncbi:MAG: hypothetical protein ACOWYE_14725 [Desulfatiglandales bacterium]